MEDGQLELRQFPKLVDAVEQQAARVNLRRWFAPFGLSCAF